MWVSKHKQRFSNGKQNLDLPFLEIQNWFILPRPLRRFAFIVSRHPSPLANTIRPCQCEFGRPSIGIYAKQRLIFVLWLQNSRLVELSCYLFCFSLAPSLFFEAVSFTLRSRMRLKGNWRKWLQHNLKSLDTSEPINEDQWNMNTHSFLFLFYLVFVLDNVYLSRCFIVISGRKRYRCVLFWISPVVAVLHRAEMEKVKSKSDCFCFVE